MPQRTSWKSNFHGVSLKGYMKIWHAIWKGYNSDYEVYCFDRVVQGLKAAFTLHHKFLKLFSRKQESGIPGNAGHGHDKATGRSTIKILSVV
jgi:hypothetical protein